MRLDLHVRLLNLRFDVTVHNLLALNFVLLILWFAYEACVGS
jgi:hypothetical protein